MMAEALRTDRHLHICFPEDISYLARAEEAQRRLKKGERQKQCRGCKLWFWADEMTSHTCEKPR